MSDKINNIQDPKIKTILKLFPKNIVDQAFSQLENSEVVVHCKDCDFLSCNNKSYGEGHFCTKIYEKCGKFEEAKMLVAPDHFCGYGTSTTQH